jgi:serine/threonine-protein kinase
MSLPLDADRVMLDAEAGASAVVAALGLDARPVPDPAGPAYEMWLRARHVTQLNNSKIGDAVLLLEEASRIAPTDARITATLAMAYVRRAFFIANTDAHVLQKASELARRALQLGPEVAETHLAIGHLELNTGDCVVAAGHFRVAISRAPFLPEGHEYLGRMLLEAGFLEQGLDRLSDASAIAPHVKSPKWEIARAHALEGRWDDFDHIVNDLSTTDERVVSVARYMRWRGESDKLRAFRGTLATSQQLFAPRVLTNLFSVYVDGSWEQHKHDLIAHALDLSPPNRRRRAFVAQLVAEAAGWMNDVDSTAALVQHAIYQGLFDLHWLDKCPLLASLRADPRFEKLRAHVKLRADAILDALYGDHGLKTMGETAMASG